ncbi:tunnelling fold family protein [Spartinivicinus ruber]|uniref:hypothetical protein n=1 Tax=Spartinivicinus ruber TaxID=2683272 RepID=UPI0013D02FD8|nr:hypothetical protein [Spartinivicinus ruber]
MNQSIRSFLPYYTDKFELTSLLDTVPRELKHCPVIRLHDIPLVTLSAKDNKPYTSTLTIEYTPDNKLVELHSLKAYLEAFAKQTTYLEQVIDVIYTDLKQVIEPSWLKISLERITVIGLPAMLVIDSKNDNAA